MPRARRLVLALVLVRVLALALVLVLVLALALVLALVLLAVLALLVVLVPARPPQVASGVRLARLPRRRSLQRFDDASRPRRCPRAQAPGQQQ